MTKSKYSKKFVFGSWQKVWIKSLRSGNNDQCTGKLCSVTYKEFDPEKVEGFSFCCLGLLNEVFFQNGIKTKVEVGTHGVSYDGMGSGLSEKQRQRVNLYSHFGDINENYLTYLEGVDEEKTGELEYNRSLAEMNDEGESFDEIADALEANPWLYFTGTA